MTEKKKILLVEDEALIALNEIRVLEEHGFETLHVCDAESAIDTVNESTVDLILMDIDLGPDRIDGTRAAEAILDRHEVPIVFLTSHAEREIVEKVKGITRYGYILKDSGEFVLIETITMALEYSRRTDALNPL
jgi:DNA-binding NarL/FixJ family response regulator